MTGPASISSAELVASLREQILEQSCSDCVSAIGNNLAIAMDPERTAAYRDPNTTTATQILAETLTARGLIAVAAQGLADACGAPMPICHAAIMDLINNPPANYEAQLERIDQNGESHGKL